MAKTRTQSGTIEPLKYDPGTLKLRGEKPVKVTKRPKGTSPTKKEPPKKKTNENPATTQPTSKATQTEAPLINNAGELLENLKAGQPLKTTIQDEEADEIRFWPDVVIGEREEEGLR